MDQQLNLFNYGLERKQITKKTRLIELFSGIGAQAKALEIMGVDFEHYKTCEWASPSIKAYNAIHIKDFTDYSANLSKEELIAYLDGNISNNYSEPCNVRKQTEKWLRETYNSCIATHNLMNIMKVKGEDLEIKDTDKYEYIMSYSFPCQDLSLAGTRGGMSVSQSEGGTRSGLLREVERILTELFEKEKELPQILLCENVPEIMSEQSLPDLQKWVKRLEEFGYTSHYAILNSKEFNVPQNRKRFFMVSILGEYAYEFPIKMKLKYKLKDFLEKETEEKYYLTEQAIERISKWKSQQDPLKNINEEKIICPTVLASNSHGEHGGMVLINESLFEENEIVDYSSSADFMRNHSNKVVPTIVCHDKFGVVEKIPIKNATKEGYVMAEDGDGIDISSRMEYHRGTVQKGLSQTLTCSGGNNVGVVAPGTTHKLRIRKLTPRECIRLMGFEDKDTDSMYQIGLGDTKIWHCAGDSIVVPVLIAILSPLYFNDTKHIEIINNYLGEKYEN